MSSKDKSSQDRFKQGRSRQDRFIQDKSRQIMTDHFRTNHARKGQIRTGQVRTCQVMTGKVWSGQLKTGQVRSGQEPIFYKGGWVINLNTGPVYIIYVYSESSRTKRKTLTWDSSMALLSSTCFHHYWHERRRCSRSPSGGQLDSFAFPPKGEGKQKVALIKKLIYRKLLKMATFL